MKQPRFSGIDGLKGGEHVFAVASLGRKDNRGIPIEKDRFHIVNPHETDGKRLYHEDYEPFNSAPKELRTTIRGNIMHASMRDCFGMQLFNFINKGVGRHPKELPFCEGDGVRARRWMGKTPNNFVDMDCPNQKCPFAISKECKSMMRFYFRIRWTPVDSQKPIDAKFSTLPTTMFKYVSKGWNMARNFLGFFEDIDNMAKGLGLTSYSLVGLPFVMRVYDRTGKNQKGEGVRYPVASISAETDILSFFRMQKEMLSYITAGQQPVGLLSDGEQNPKVIAQDWRSVSIVEVPATYQEVDEKSQNVATPEEKEKQKIVPPKEENKKPVPLEFNDMIELAKVQAIPKEKLARFVYDAFVKYAEVNNCSYTEAYKRLYAGENENGKPKDPVEWNKAKQTPELLKVYAMKAKAFILSLEKKL
jgi:hypothetical protein